MLELTTSLSREPSDSGEKDLGAQKGVVAHPLLQDILWLLMGTTFVVRHGTVDQMVSFVKDYFGDILQTDIGMTPQPFRDVLYYDLLVIFIPDLYECFALSKKSIIIL